MTGTVTVEDRKMKAATWWMVVAGFLVNLEGAVFCRPGLNIGHRAAGFHAGTAQHTHDRCAMVKSLG